MKNSMNDYHIQRKIKKLFLKIFVEEISPQKIIISFSLNINVYNITGNFFFVNLFVVISDILNRE